MENDKTYPPQPPQPPQPVPESVWEVLLQLSSTCGEKKGNYGKASLSASSPWQELMGAPLHPQKQSPVRFCPLALPHIFLLNLMLQFYDNTAALGNASVHLYILVTLIVQLMLMSILVLILGRD